jgi:flagellar transcriptional activator FlhD
MPNKKAYARPDSGLLRDIAEVNLAYLTLGQKLLRTDFERGLQDLGMDRKAGELLLGLDARKLQRLAASSNVLCRFRMVGHLLLSRLAPVQVVSTLKSSNAELVDQQAD